MLLSTLTPYFEERLSKQQLEITEELYVLLCLPSHTRKRRYRVREGEKAVPCPAKIPGDLARVLDAFDVFRQETTFPRAPIRAGGGEVLAAASGSGRLLSAELRGQGPAPLLSLQGSATRTRNDEHRRPRCTLFPPARSQSRRRGLCLCSVLRRLETKNPRRRGGLVALFYVSSEVSYAALSFAYSLARAPLICSTVTQTGGKRKAAREPRRMQGGGGGSFSRACGLFLDRSISQSPSSQQPIPRRLEDDQLSVMGEFVKLLIGEVCVPRASVDIE